MSLDTVPVLLRHDVPLIIEHMGRTPVAAPSEWAPLLDLLTHPDVWIKLSGADRIPCDAHDLQAALPLMTALLQHAPTRAIWDSDWPHVNIRHPRPSVPDLLALLRRACGPCLSLPVNFRNIKSLMNKVPAPWEGPYATSRCHPGAR